MYQATETQTERLHDEWIREFAASALGVLVDEVICEYPTPLLTIDEMIKEHLSVALKNIFLEKLPANTMIEWAARLSSDVLSFEAFEARETE